MSKTNIIVNLQVEGLHNWPDAKNIIPEMAYLSNIHRHIFYINCKKVVTHDDRDVEIIQFKNKVLAYLYNKYGNKTEISTRHICDFQSNSCEMLSRELALKFDLEYCSVLEDNENGAEYIK